MRNSTAAGVVFCLSTLISNFTISSTAAANTEPQTSFGHIATSKDAQELGSATFLSVDQWGFAAPGIAFGMFGTAAGQDPTTPIALATSDQNGLVTFHNLPLHDYEIRRIGKPDNFNETAPQPRRITLTSNKRDINLTADPIVSQRTGGIIRVFATDAADPGQDEILLGGQFELHSRDGRVFKPTEPETNEGFIYFKGLPDGQYLLVETTPIKGYNPFSSNSRLTITKGNTVLVKLLLTKEVHTTKKGEPLFTAAQPTAEIPTVTQKSTPLYISEKPAVEIPLITQKGAPAFIANRPISEIPLIIKKGGSVSIAGKPVSEIPLILKKGESTSIAEKTVAEVPLVTKKGASAATAEKPNEKMPAKIKSDATAEITAQVTPPPVTITVSVNSTAMPEPALATPVVTAPAPVVTAPAPVVTAPAPAPATIPAPQPVLVRPSANPAPQPSSAAPVVPTPAPTTPAPAPDAATPAPQIPSIIVPTIPAPSDPTPAIPIPAPATPEPRNEVATPPTTQYYVPRGKSNDPANAAQAQLNASAQSGVPGAAAVLVIAGGILFAGAGVMHHIRTK